MDSARTDFRTRIWREVERVVGRDAAIRQRPTLALASLKVIVAD